MLRTGVNRADIDIVHMALHVLSHQRMGMHACMGTIAIDSCRLDH